MQRLGNGDHWHDIRAGFVTHVAITSGGVAAQSLARHADFSTTLNYIHVADEVKRAAANRAGRLREGELDGWIIVKNHTPIRQFTTYTMGESCPKPVVCARKSK